MKLKTAIYIVNSVTGFFIISGCLGIVLCIMTLRQVALVIGILVVAGLFIAARFFKIRLINYYLKTCKYPFEFLSVLEQLGLTRDLQINWSDHNTSGIDKSPSDTEKFLADNTLITDIGKSAQNNAEPFICFRENGLLVNNQAHEWKNIIEWGFIDSDTSAGKMEITCVDNASTKKLLIDLDQTKVNYIDLMLLLTHFKAKFS